MLVKELVELLERFHPQAEVRLSVSLPGRVIATYERLWVADYGGGPQIHAANDFKQFSVYVGCGLEQMVRPVPERPYVLEHAAHGGAHPAAHEPVVDLGQYADEESAAKVRDFYIYHKKLGEPLRYPDLDYEHWIPPRTVSGEYNEHIAKILREKLLEE